MEELEEEAENERQSRIKCEKQMAHLSQELEEISEKLRDAGGSASVQADMNKRKDLEIHKLRRQLDDVHQQQEAHLEAVKNKHIQALTETTERLEKQTKTNHRYVNAAYLNNC